ncbi:phage tail tape measure protein, partial [Rossellomorea sp. BNER]|uniref:phage tail tape measure protein n=1 Tax=Rossellomorea sp. BNER TaxID=2962031 RepID=UPI003AF2995A|nr:phage tail tape measure protein [Rossellomorea sp. BNER]
SEVTRGVNQLMHNFGLTSQEAMDLFAKGQSEGLNYSQEMFDNISEYAPLFKQMGFSANEYFAILANGSQNGAYNLDYINDIMKEFDIRVRDGSKTTAEAFGSMSQKTQNMFRKFKDGKITTEELFNTVIPELEKMDDQVLANQIGVGLFGTKFEDMGAKTVYSLNDVNTSLNNTKGAMDALGKSQEESFGTKLQNALRSVGEALEPIGIILLNMLIAIAPYLKQFSEWFQNLSPTIQTVIVAIGGLVTVIGPLLAILGFVIQGIMPIVGLFTKLWGWLSKLAPLFNVLRVAFLAITGPVGLIVLAVIGLIAIFVTLWNKSDAFRNFFIQCWNNIKTLVSVAVQAIKTAISVAWVTIKVITKTVFNAVKTFLTVVWNAIKTAISTVINVIKNVITSVWNKIKSVTSSVFNGVKSVISSVWNGIKSVISSVVNSVRSTVSNVWNNIRSRTSSVFNSIRSIASSVWNRIKSTITDPIESAKRTVLGIINTIKSAFSRMSIKIPKPKIPHISVDMRWKKIKGLPDIPYPDFDLTWHKTGGVFTKPVVAGNAGFGDVEEGIVPFEGSHAMKIAKLIAAAQNKIKNVSNGLVGKALNNLLVVKVESSEISMDGRAVGKVVWKTVNEEIQKDEVRDARARGE